MKQAKKKNTVQLPYCCCYGGHGVERLETISLGLGTLHQCLIPSFQIPVVTRWLSLDLFATGSYFS